MKKLALIAAISAVTTSAFAVDYQIDHSHSAVTFEIGHLGVSLTPGRFNEFSGSYSFNEDDMSDIEVSLTIETSSIDTNHEDRDKHLRSPDFFDARQYPEITFTSTGFEGDAERGTLMGEMTMLGETLPVEFEVTKIGEGEDPWGGYRHGLVAETTINRSEFGMDYFIPGVSDETYIKVFIEGIRQ
ncbi:YceI family protein [Salinibius halmophilus]|uniref:YceI family protein n=1 Tax=Salinibius halmophilus TaxID=1853216 RepID=UPI000E66E143|nr:YceI family protein [Salinibius halmophilus]